MKLKKCIAPLVLMMALNSTEVQAAKVKAPDPEKFIQLSVQMKEDNKVLLGRKEYHSDLAILTAEELQDYHRIWEAQQGSEYIYIRQWEHGGIHECVWLPINRLERYERTNSTPSARAIFARKLIEETQKKYHPTLNEELHYGVDKRLKEKHKENLRVLEEEYNKKHPPLIDWNKEWSK